MSIRKLLSLLLMGFMSLLIPIAASAQVSAPYWYGNYNYNNNYWPYYRYNYRYHPPYQNYTYIYVTPSCTITATTPYANSYGGYASYGSAGNYYQTLILSWSSSNATSAYLYPSGTAVSTSGSMTVYANGNTTYTLTVNGSGGSSTCQTTYYQPTYYQPTYYSPMYSQPNYYQPQYNYYPYTNYQPNYWTY